MALRFDRLDASQRDTAQWGLGNTDGVVELEEKISVCLVSARRDTMRFCNSRMRKGSIHGEALCSVLFVNTLSVLFPYFKPSNTANSPRLNLPPNPSQKKHTLNQPPVISPPRHAVHQPQPSHAALCPFVSRPFVSPHHRRSGGRRVWGGAASGGQKGAGLRFARRRDVKDGALLFKGIGLSQEDI